MFQTEVVEKIKTHVLFSVTFMPALTRCQCNPREGNYLMDDVLINSKANQERLDHQQANSPSNGYSALHMPRGGSTSPSQ
jgi:hypothetical protein